MWMCAERRWNGTRERSRSRIAFVVVADGRKEIERLIQLT